MTGSARACDACGSAAAEGAAWCSHCGARLAPPPARGPVGPVIALLALLLLASVGLAAWWLIRGFGDRPGDGPPLAATTSTSAPAAPSTSSTTSSGSGSAAAPPDTGTPGGSAPPSAPATTPPTSTPASTQPTPTGGPSFIEIPDSARLCGIRNDGIYADAWAGNAQTSCPFALQVGDVYEDIVPEPTGETIRIQVHSSVTGRDYLMTCAPTIPVRCTGGTNAVVYLGPYQDSG